MSHNARFLFLLAAIILFGATSCTKHQNSNSVPITRLDRVIAEYNSLSDEQRHDVAIKYQPELTALMQVLEIDSVATDGDIALWASSFPVEKFSPMADTAFTNLDNLELNLGYILEQANKQGLTLPQRRYVAVVWGRAESIVFNDSIALIALNHYLGPDSPAYQGWDEYRKVNKRPDMIPYDLAEALVAIQYPYSPIDGHDNVMARMLYEGVMTEAKMRLVPDATLPAAMGFTNEQFKDLQENREFIWNKLNSEQMLYSSDEALMDRLFKPLPFSTPISNAAPGRTVRFTGHEIIRYYLKNNPGTTLEQMLKPEFYSSPETLRKSQYVPK